MRLAMVLGFLPTYVRAEVEALGSLGVETEIWLPGRDGFMDSITGRGLPRGASRGGSGGELVIDSPSAGQAVGAALSSIGAFLRRPPSMVSLAAEALQVSSPSLLAYGARLADALSRRPPDRIHSHFAWEPAAVAMYASRLLGVPWSLTVHAADIFTPRRPGLVRLMMEHACPLFTISDFDREFISENWGARYGERTLVSRLGIDLLDLPPWTGAGSRILWCTASGLAEKKGVDVLLDACALMREELAGWRCVIVGSDRDGATLGRCRNLATRMGLDGLVEFPGALPSHEVLAGTAGAAVVVLPCVKAESGDMDGIPVALMEAMGIGVPVVSTRLSGIPELIEDGVSGLLVRPGDPEALAAAIRRLLRDPGAAVGFGGAGRARIAERYAAGNHAREMMDAWASPDCRRPHTDETSRTS